MIVLLDATPATVPDGLLAGVALIITAIGGVLTVLVNAWLKRLEAGQRRAQRVTDEIRDQVSNTHTTNLRVDIDGITSKLDLALHELRTQGREIGRIHDTLAADNARITALDQRVTGIKTATDHILHDHSLRIHEVETKQPDWRDNP